MTFQFRNCQNSRTLWFPLSDMWLQFWIHRHYQQNSWGWLIYLQLDVSAAMNQDVGSNMMGWTYQRQISQNFLVSRIFPLYTVDVYVGKCQLFFGIPCIGPVARRSKILILASLLEMPGPCDAVNFFQWSEMMHTFEKNNCSQHFSLSGT